MRMVLQLFYDQGDMQFKNKERKDRLMEQNANELSLTGHNLHIIYL